MDPQEASPRSPFPGMDPYIEACGLWEDFHDTIVTEIKKALAEVVPDRYTVRSGERTYIVLAAPEDDLDASIQSQPDVAVLLPRGADGPRRADDSRRAPERELESGTPATGIAPVSMRALVTAEHRESFIEIRDARPERRLVTTIEVLSPSNKRSGSPGWTRYLRKRQAHLAGHANLVEIDLLRGGERMPMEDEWPESPYYFLSSRREDAPRCTVWPADFRRPLPGIPVPLAPPDADVELSLQPMVERIYAESRYWRDIDYAAPCRPPLGEEDSAWIAARIDGRQAGP